MYQLSMKSQIQPELAVTQKSTKRTIFRVPYAIKNSIKILFDCQLLKSITFIVIAIVGFLTVLGSFTPFIFITGKSTTV